MIETSLPCGQENSSGYELTLAIPVNNMPANGSAADTAKAVLTYKGSGKPVPDRWITFQVTAGSAKFPNGNMRKTSSDGSAQVEFTDTTPDAAGEMIAYLTENNDVQSNLVCYSFTARPPAWVLKLNVTVNFRLTNEARATIFEIMPPRLAPCVKFQLNPRLVATKYVKFVADVSNIKEMGDGYVVLLAQPQLNSSAKWFAKVRMQASHLPFPISGTLTASLPDYPGIEPQQQPVTFE